MLNQTYENKMQPVTDTVQFEPNIALISGSALQRYLGLDPSSCDAHGSRVIGHPRSIFSRHAADYAEMLRRLSPELIQKQADAILGSGLPTVTEPTYQIKADGTLEQASPRRVESRKWQLLPGVPEPQWLPKDKQLRDAELRRMETDKPQPYARFRDGKWQGRHPDTGEWKTIEANRR